MIFDCIVLYYYIVHNNNLLLAYFKNTKFNLTWVKMINLRQLINTRTNYKCLQIRGMCLIITRIPYYNINPILLL